LAVELIDEAQSNNLKEEVRPSTSGDRLTGERLKQLAAMVLADAGADPLSSRLLWDSYGALLAHRLLTSGVAAPGLFRGGLAPWQTRRCTEYLAEHASHDVGLEQLAALVGLSPFHFARAFKRSTGLPPHRYQLNLRIARAKELLETTDAPVTEIAFDVGYESSQALARLFRREVGLSPSDYRRVRMG
jgi:AraC family transcriptional regulator